MTTVNTSASLIYDDGVLSSVIIGSPSPGLPFGTVETEYVDFAVTSLSPDGRVDGSTASHIAASVTYGISVAINAGLPSGAIVQVVPEPTSLEILGVAAMALIWRRRPA